MHRPGSASLLLLVSLLMTACSSPEPPSSTPRSRAPYGAWRSPITAARATAGALRFDHLVLDGDDLYWVEGRASEGGRAVVVRRSANGTTTDVTPADANVRSRVHEYGGAAYAVDRGVVFYSNFADQRVYRREAGGVPSAVTGSGYFFADYVVDARRQRLIAVREDHTKGETEPANGIAAIAMAGDPARAPGGTLLVSGADFYSDPILSPDGTRLAWLQWNHPHMPWNATELWVGTLTADGTLGERHKVAGEPDESIFQPSWSPDGTLFYVSDLTGWWNLYRQVGSDRQPIHPMARDFGKPQWTFSMSTYAFISPRQIAVTYSEEGRWKLALIELEPRRFEPIDLAVEPLESLRANQRSLYFIGGSATQAPAVTQVTLAAVEAEVLRRSTADDIAASSIAVPEALTFPSGGTQVHAFYYPPTNPAFAAAEGEKPPLLVVSHGGPTSAAEAVLDLDVQFWTSRGFAVLDVNYRGSTGYGRAYRDALNGQWGIADVEDVVNGASFLVEQGRVDPKRLAIRGGSAGGYTTLAALAFHRTFGAGASYYGISDIEVLARDTHKFESRYLDTLIGPYPAARDLYRARSPIHAADRITAGLILFQGLEDKVVPPNQSQMMADTLRARGIPVAYLTFEGEQHGFRRAENVVRSLEAELAFYGAIFGFSPADPIEPVAIDNLPAKGTR